MIAYAVLSLALLTLSGWLMDRHRRTWFEARGDDSLTPEHRRYAHWQYWRRMVSSATIGVVGVLIAVQPVVPARPLAMTVYLLSLLFGCLVILIGGIADAFAGARFHRRVHLELKRRQAQLSLELLQASKREAGPSSDDT